MQEQLDRIEKRLAEVGPSTVRGNPRRVLLENLLTEMVQTEESAKQHPRKEAARFAATRPPAVALLAVSEHAERALAELAPLAAARSRSLGVGLGKAFSGLRNAVLDRLISREKSYRATLVGLHHGLDCALLVLATAHACGRADIVAFCTRWLDERRPLLAECQRQVTWFADYPDVALERSA